MRRGKARAGSWITTASDTAPKAWLAAIDGIGPKLWTLFAGKLDAALKQAGRQERRAAYRACPRARWASCRWNSPAIPPAAGPLPMPIISRKFQASKPISRRPALPRRPGRLRWPRPSTLPATIPRLNLPYTEVEGAAVAARFKGKPLVKLDRSSATPEVVLAGLKGKSYWHFASHGLFDWDDARQSGLLMKDRQLLTVGALIDARGTPEPRGSWCCRPARPGFTTRPGTRTSSWACPPRSWSWGLAA